MCIHSYIVSLVVICTCVTLFFFLILEVNRLIVPLDAAAEKALSSSDSFTPEQRKGSLLTFPHPLNPLLTLLDGQ